MSTRTQTAFDGDRFFADHGHTELARTVRRIFDFVLNFVDRAVPRISPPERRLPANVVRLNTTFDAARALRQLRVRARITQTEFANLLGVSESRLLSIEIGEVGCLEALQTCKRARAILENTHENAAGGSFASQADALRRAG